jgi:LacI family transcriptional regulator
MYNERNVDPMGVGEQVTLHDIAREAGTSVTTVSRALQGKPDISENTKVKIKAIAEGMGYVPNVQARALRLNHNKVLGIVNPDNSNPFYAKLIKGVEEKARDLNYSVLVGNTGDRSEVERDVLLTFTAMRVAGILAIPTDVGNYYDLKAPLIFLLHYEYGTKEHYFNSVTTNNIRSAYLATSHLLARGKKTVFLLNNGRKSFSSTLEREEGYRKALDEANIPYNEKCIYCGEPGMEYGMEYGYKALNLILKETAPPFGVFCVTDFIAVGAMRAIKEKKFKIPDDISIVGCDDIEIASYLDILLTTVKHSGYMTGVIGTEHIMKLIERPNSMQQRIKIVLEPELIIRESS